MTARDVIAGALVTGSNDVWSIADRVLRELESAGYEIVKPGYDTNSCDKMLKAAKRAAMTFPQTDGLDFSDMIDSVILAGVRAAIQAVNE